VPSIKGILPALVTPFDRNNKINRPVLRTLVQHLIESGVHGLFVLGSQGEFWALSHDEKKVVLETVLDEAAGRVPVYAGTGAVSTREVIELTKMAEAVGADAISVITPFFLSPTQEELYNHYREIAASARLPVLVYTNPGRTGVNLSPEVVARLSKIDNIVGIKDSSGDLTLTGEYISRADSDFAVLAGRDTLILATLLYGGRGAVAATANVAPKLAVEIYEAFMEGDLDRAKRAQEQLNPVRLAFGLGSFPAVIKEALELMGLPVGPARLPVGPMEESQREILKGILGELGYLGTFR
jgi:4-hydroxy-tetrahydrodipicolinate synthase